MRSLAGFGLRSYCCRPHNHLPSSPRARSAAAFAARRLYVTDIVMYKPFGIAMFGILSTVGDFVEYLRVDALAPSTRRALGKF